MKSIVASATEFMSATTKPLGAFCIGPLARTRSSNSATGAMVLCPAARVFEVISSDTPSCASALRFLGLDNAQVIQFRQAWKNCSCGSALTGRFFKVADAISALSSR
jgi:hypothetical protein